MPGTLACGTGSTANKREGDGGMGIRTGQDGGVAGGKRKIMEK